MQHDDYISIPDHCGIVFFRFNDLIVDFYYDLRKCEHFQFFQFSYIDTISFNCFLFIIDCYNHSRMIRINEYRCKDKNKTQLSGRTGFLPAYKELLIDNG